ncbi:MAG: ABC transporter ATP-binding protein [Patescibacteria group bacterium]|nr:ABC transporter ATP-binding protein [Patescibacteria group bacterium]
MPTLETKNIKKHFEGVKAVDGLSLKFEAGQITGVVGPNGSGKSTLVNLLTGMAPYQDGEVIFSGAEGLRKLLPHEVANYGVARTFQDVRLFEQMPVLDNILVVLTERGVFSSIFERHGDFHLAQAEEVLRKVGLWSKRNELAVNLSYGQRKLLEIARVLAMIFGRGASIVFLDEPFAGLFPEMIKVVVSVLEELKQQNRTIILIEHNMELIRQLSDHVYVLDAGQELAAGKPEKALGRPEVIEAYLGE